MTAGTPPTDAQPVVWPLGAREVLTSLVALATVAIAQPLLDLIGRNATFLVAHDVTRFDVIGLGIALPILVPLTLGAVVLLLRPLRPVAAGLHAILLGLLGAALVLLVLRLTGAMGALHWAAILGIAAVVGAVVPVGYRFSESFRKLLPIAAFAAPAVTALFLFASPANALAFPSPPPAPVAGDAGDAPPLVFIIFDELPIASLLGPDRLVDAEAFPNFARLAEDSTLYRNVTTVHGQTTDAVPAALDGKYPRAEALPVAADHPDNLIARLSATNGLHVSEAVTELCPPGRCPKAAGSAPLRYGTLARDIAVVGSHLVLPPALTTGLPAIDQGWRDFGAQARAEGGKERAMHVRFNEARKTPPARGFEAFVSGITPRQRPSLSFVHTLLPHSPWQFLPDGREYAKEWDWPALIRGRWIEDDWRVAQTQQRHLLQTQLVDRLLGTLLDKLEATGIYDDAVVVLMADHGASFMPNTSLRVIQRETFGEIGAVPLFIKRPGEPGGQVSDRPMESIDIFPSVLDALGLEPPPDIDGRSVFDESAPPRTSKQFFGPTGPLTFPADGQEKWAAVDRKEFWFGRSDAFPFPYGLAPDGHEDLLGTPVPDDSPAALPQLSVELAEPDAYDDVDLAASLVPAYLKATVVGPLQGSRPAIAIGVNGVISAVTLLEDDDSDRRPLRAMLPPSQLREGANDVSFWLVQSYGLVELTVAE